MPEEVPYYSQTVSARSTSTNVRPTLEMLALLLPVMTMAPNS